MILLLLSAAFSNVTIDIVNSSHSKVFLSWKGAIVSVLLLATLLLTPVAAYAASTSFHCWAFGWVLQLVGKCAGAPVVVASTEPPSAPLPPPPTSTISPALASIVPPPPSGSTGVTNTYITNQLVGGTGVSEAVLNQRIFDVIGYINTQISQAKFMLTNTGTNSILSRLKKVEERRIYSFHTNSDDNHENETMLGDTFFPTLSPNVLTYINETGKISSAIGVGYNSNSLLLATTTAHEVLTVDGAIYLSSTTPRRVDNALYNLAGTLYWNGQELGGATGSSSNLGALTDVTISSPASGQVLSYNGSQWVNIATSSLGFGSGAGSAFSNSSGLATLLSDETGTGFSVFNGSPTFAGTALFNALTASSTLTLTGTAANIALGSNFLSGDGDDEGIFIGSSGNVGVGTSSPAVKFHLVDSSVPGASYSPDDILTLEKNGNANVNFIANNTGNSGFLFSDSDARAQGLFRYVHLTNRFEWRTAAAFRMLLDGTGLGIGTVSPLTPLHVASSSNGVVIDAGFFSNSFTTLNSGARIYLAGNGSLVRNAYIAGVNTTGVGAGHSLLFGTSGSGTDPIERMRITDTGNIGIGTTTPSATLSVTGTVRFANLTGGDLTTDSLGNLSVSSDERLKDIQGSYAAGLEEVMKLDPITYHWNELSSMETTDLNAGFSAQNVMAVLPEAVGQGKNGFLTLTIRPIVAALVNSVKELYAMVTQNTAAIEELRLENEALQQRLSDLERAVNGQPAQPPHQEPGDNSSPDEESAGVEEEVVVEEIVEDPEETEVPVEEAAPEVLEAIE